MPWDKLQTFKECRVGCYKGFREAEDQTNDKKNELVEGDGDKREY